MFSKLGRFESKDEKESFFKWASLQGLILELNDADHPNQTVDATNIVILFPKTKHDFPLVFLLKNCNNRSIAVETHCYHQLSF